MIRDNILENCEIFRFIWLKKTDKSVCDSVAKSNSKQTISLWDRTHFCHNHSVIVGWFFGRNSPPTGSISLTLKSALNFSPKAILKVSVSSVENLSSCWLTGRQIDRHGSIKGGGGEFRPRYWILWKYVICPDVFDVFFISNYFVNI